MIDKSKKEYVERLVFQICKRFQINTWPVDTFALLKRLKLENLLDVTVEFHAMPMSVDAGTMKIGSKYIITVNSRKWCYPYMTSKDRRANFSLSHEFFHITLRHCDVPENTKTDELKKHEDEEADLFAAFLLMPEHMLRTSNFINIPAVAKALIVSEHALLRRLTELDLHKLRKDKPISLCPVCGHVLENEYNYCPTCCADVRENRKGVLRHNFLYTGTEKICDVDPGLIAVFRYKCDVYYLGNRCSNKNCKKDSHPNSAYCYVCGYETTYMNRQLILDWKGKRDLLLSQINLEVELRKVYGEVYPAPEWEDFYAGLPSECRYLLNRSASVIADDALIICSHYITKVNMDSSEMAQFTKAINRLAKKCGSVSVFVLPARWLNEEPMVKWPKWLKQRQMGDFMNRIWSDKPLSSPLHTRLAEVGMSIYDFVPRKALV